MPLTVRTLCQLTLTLALPCSAPSSASAADPSDPIELMASPRGGYYQMMMSVKESGNSGWYVVDTGSTGIRGSAHFFGLTEAEQKGACEYKGYSSSGISYAGYTVNRTITLRSINPAYKGAVTVSNIPVFAAVQSCPKGTKAQCTTTPRNDCTNTPHVSMMGVGYGRYAQAKATPVNPANPFINIDRMVDGELPRTYLAGPLSSDGLMFTLGAAVHTPLPYKASQTFAVTGTYQNQNSLVGPVGRFVITDGTTGEVLYPQVPVELTARLLPDTGIGYGIVSVTGNGAPCCVDKSLHCRGSKNSLPPDTTVQFFGPVAGQGPLTSITYPANKDGKSQCLRWSVQPIAKKPPVPATTPLFNSGHAFFKACGLLYAPEANTMTIGCNR